MTIDVQDRINAAKMRWFDTIPEPWPLTDDAADEARDRVDRGWTASF